MIWKIIKTAMIRSDIRSIRELSDRTGITWSTLAHTRKTDPGSFRLYELKQMDKVLRFTDSEWEGLRA